MLKLRLPDGAVREVPEGTLPRDVVGSIGSRLLRDAIAVSVDGEIQDLVTPLRSGGDFRVLTAKDQPALDVLRHSGAHVLATAVRRKPAPRARAISSEACSIRRGLSEHSAGARGRCWKTA